jgi:hypothetical protein
VRYVVLALLFALALGACDGGAESTPGATAAPSGDPGAAPPPVVSARAICRLAGDTSGARDATITGVDGTQSVLVGGTAYWFFGDTVRRGPDGRSDVIQASLATTQDHDAGDCIDLRFKTDASGVVASMLPRGAETTAWPDGVLALDDGSIVFYMVKAVRTSPFAWHTGGAGLGRIPPGSTDGVRVVEEIWRGDDFAAPIAGVRSPLRAGDDVYVYIRTDDGANYVARVPLDRMGERDAYAYYDGAGWTNDPRAARPMWPVVSGVVPPDNGVQVTYDEGIGAYLALYNRELAFVDVRTAPDPWGPWSEPVTWLDCRPLVGARYPFCYSSEVHRHLGDDADVRYITISSQEPYDVMLVELRLNLPGD